MTQQSSKRTGVIITENGDSGKKFFICPAAIYFILFFVQHLGLLAQKPKNKRNLANAK
jgi:hypothetical protein